MYQLNKIQSADDTVILTTGIFDPIKASEKLQSHLDQFKIGSNAGKSI